MKQKLIISAFCAMALLACNSGQKQNNGGNASAADSVEKTEITQEIPEDNTEEGLTIIEKADMTIAEEIFRKEFPEIKQVSSDSLTASGSNDDECEGCNSYSELACYPLKDGGYLAVFLNSFAGPDCPEELHYYTKTYKNGELSDGIKLPSPTLEQLLNPSKMEKYKNEIASFKSVYSSSYQKLYFNPPYSFTIELYPYDCDEEHPGMEDCMLSHRNPDDKPLKYNWNGENFVCAAANPLYDVDNLNGKYVDFSRPVLIMTKNIWKDDDGNLDEEGEGEGTINEYCRYDSKGRILEYGCMTGQYDYEGYIRMFKINYNGDKIDSVQWKEVYNWMVSEKKDLIFKKGVSLFDQITGQNIGFIHDADKDVNGLDPYSISSMREYADTKNDILERQFGIVYDFNYIKWDNVQKDGQGRLTYSEYKENRGGDEYLEYKIKYSYGDDYVKKIINKKECVLVEEYLESTDFNYNQTAKYLRTDQPSK